MPRRRVALRSPSLAMVLIAFALACGDYGEEASAPGPAANGSDSGADGNDGSGDVDGGTEDVAVTSCHPDQPFAGPSEVLGLAASGPAVSSAFRLTSDELTVYFHSNRSAGSSDTDLYVATRSTRELPFGTPTRLESVSTTESESSPTLSLDGLTLLFTRTDAGASDYQLYVATRQNKLAAFGEASPLAEPVNTNGVSESAPWLTPNGLYFNRNVPNAVPTDIFRAPSVGGAFGTPIALTELNTSAEDGSPITTRDDLAIYWASMRTDLGARGQFDVLVATRKEPTSAFGNVRNVAEVNTASSEIPTWISDDACRLYFERGGTLFVVHHVR